MIENDQVPAQYSDAIEKATADKGRRERRLKWVKKEIGIA